MQKVKCQSAGASVRRPHTAGNKYGQAGPLVLGCMHGCKICTRVLVRVLGVSKGEPYHGVLAEISKLRPHVPLTNRWK